MPSSRIHPTVGPGRREHRSGAGPSTKRWSSTPRKVINPTFRNYRIPAFADIPRSEILYAKTNDIFGPFGAKSMSEAPINPVAPALANALEDATGIRFHDLPLAPDRIYKPIFEKFAGTNA